MKIYKVKHLFVMGITLCPIGIFVKEKYARSPSLINHESIHWQQQLELFIIPFYILYLLEWFVNVIRRYILKENIRPYRDISFEREAYINQSNPNYLTKRLKYSSFYYYK